jgi:hypothetical protein
MAAESPETGQDQLESLIDDLIREKKADLIEAASALSRTPSRTSALERLLLAEAVASALADALAPTLAEAFAPKVLERLEQLTTGESTGKE